VIGVLRRKRAARRERKLREYAEKHGLDPAELERLRDQQSPFRAKWGFFPKC
jgi:hypothetical protein